MFSPSDITVYVPYFNAARTITRCVDSLKNQSVSPFEILIVDDGSEEPLPETVDCRVIHHPKNKGLSAARNTALNACETKLIASVDADVLTEESWLETLLVSLNDSGSAGAGGKMTEFYQESLGDRWRAVHMAQHWGDEAKNKPRFLFGANSLFQTAILKDLGGYNEKLRTNNEDRTISDLVYESGRSLFYEPSAKCFHLRQDKTETILSAYWGWHHAKGLVEGDFDSVEGIISRISRVNFGISNYRYNLDKESGREDFLLLDLLIPYIFCCRDILMYCQRNSIVVPDLSQMASVFDLESSVDLETFVNFPHYSNRVNSWFDKYLETFKCQLKEFMTVEKLKGLDLSSWLKENIDRVFEKKR